MMKNLLRADIYRVMKSKLTLVALILALAFPVLIVLLYAGLGAIMDLDPEIAGTVTLFNANSIIGSAYSMTNNLGLVVPAFAGILVCLDYTNGTLRNKIIAGNRRTAVYMSHLTVSVLFSVVIITIYAAVTAGLALIFFPFDGADSPDRWKEILFFVLNGTMGFVFIATVSTFLAMVTRSVAPTLIFTIVITLVLLAVNTVLALADYHSFRYAAYLIPNFTANFFNLNSMSALGIMGQAAEESRGLMFAEGMLSYLFFGAVNTAAGIVIFNKRDIK
jgi:hypothetical protein